MNQSHEHESNNESWLFSRTGIATLVAVSVLGFLIYEGHGTHLLGLLPYLLILACPLMHIFMHGGHHHSNDKQGGSNDAKKQQKHKGGCH